MVDGRRTFATPIPKESAGKVTERISIEFGPSTAAGDIPTDLQPLVDQCHERGRYHLLDYRTELDPPFPPNEAARVDQVLREGSLR